MKNIVWLASYPKSGNTWFRTFLANLLREKAGPADINRLGSGPIFSARHLFDTSTGLSSSDLLPSEIDQLRPMVYERMSDNATTTLFIKAHDAYTYLEDGRPIFPTRATRGAIYLIRNPLDVAPSFANHSSCSLDQIIRQMNDESDSFCGHPGELSQQLRQHLLGWSGHVTSWLNAKAIRVHFIRYEDMKTKPLETFRAAIQFAGLEYSDEAILQALEACRFEKLQAQEKDNGFREKAVKTTAFFWKGKIGGWQASLTSAQARTLIEQHSEIMKRFGYVDETGEVTEIIRTEGKKNAPRLTHLTNDLPKKYALYGLSISLPFFFDELSPTERKSDINVTLQALDCRDMVWAQEGICIKSSPGRCLLTVAGVGDYLIEQGERITIERVPGADRDAVKLFLLNSAMGIAMMQRGRLPLWGSCVVYQGRAFALLGQAAVGKSMFAAGLKERGFQVLSDNLCVLSDHQNPAIYPGYPFQMLWRQGLEHLKKKPGPLKPVRQGLQKYFLPLANHAFTEPVPLGGIYLLTPHNQDEYHFTLLRGFDKVFRLLDYTYNESLLKAMDLLQQQHLIAGGVAQKISVRRYHYLNINASYWDSVTQLENEIKANGTIQV